jgi:hypothetical protein
LRKSIHTLTLLFLFGQITVNAQEGRCPKLPASYLWETEKDYKKDEDLVKKTLRWLCATPYSVDVEQRSLANVFVLEWIAGSPDILVEVKTDYLPFYLDHPDLLYTFIHAVALFKIEKPGIKDEPTLYKEGFNVIAELAVQSKELSHSHALRPLLKAHKKSKMKEYVKSIQQKK